MSKTPLTPTRQKYLKVYIECLKKTERRIRASSGPGLTLRDGISISARERAARGHIRMCMSERGVEGYAQALMQLRIARSKYAAELEGKLW
jgi:hypothetical protein